MHLDTSSVTVPGLCFGSFNFIHPRPGDPTGRDQFPACKKHPSTAWPSWSTAKSHVNIKITPHSPFWAPVFKTNLKAKPNKTWDSSNILLCIMNAFSLFSNSYKRSEKSCHVEKWGSNTSQAKKEKKNQLYWKMCMICFSKNRVFLGLFVPLFRSTLWITKRRDNNRSKTHLDMRGEPQ